MTFAQHGQSGVVLGAPLAILRAEGLAVFATATLAYTWTEAPWWLYFVLFLAPDLSFFAYLAGNRAGAAAYNAFHSYVGPILLGLVGHFAGNDLVLAVALVWAAHVGIDRLLGYGLKYATAFGDTHLGRKGKAA